MCRLAADVRHLDLRPARCLSGTSLRVAISPDMPDRVQFRRDLVVACAATEERAEVMAVCGKEAGVELCPSAERRTRVQVPQKGCVTEAMIPISPAPSRLRYRLATSPR